MKKIQLEFRAKDNAYEILESKSLLLTINKKELRIDGKQFFDVFYKNKDVVPFYILTTECNDKNDQIIFKQVKDLFSKINMNVELSNSNNCDKDSAEQ